MKARTTLSAPGRGNASTPSHADSDASPIVTFTRMDQGTAEDYALLDELAKPYIAKTGERVLAYLENIADGFPGYPIDRYQHSLQTATRALRAGECEEYVVAALLHDIGDDLRCCGLMSRGTPTGWCCSMACSRATTISTRSDWTPMRAYATEIILPST